MKPISTATFRFYEELNDFLPKDRRKRDIPLEFEAGTPLGHLIETFGVPHTEVELAMVNGESVQLDHRLEDGDRVAVYPVFEAFDVSPLLRIRDKPLRDPRFLADAHLAKLARLLRMLGFDTSHFDQDPGDARLAEIAAEEGRILLTRDRALLMHKQVDHGCFIHPLRPLEQLGYLVERLQLTGRIQPFSRCMLCNHPIHPITADQAAGKAPSRILANHRELRYCQHCDKVYWKGSHYQRMMALIDGLH